MTQSPKEKADELIEKFKGIETNFSRDGGYTFENIYREDAIQCALIAVDEMIHYLEIVLGVDRHDFEYWQQVKAELENK